MKVNVIFLDYERHDFTERVKQQNFNNAGHPFDVVILSMKGISAAINEGILRSHGYDAIVTMANDIIMPDNWLRNMVIAAQSIPETGMCGIHCVEGLGTEENYKGVAIHKAFTSFGNVLIPMNAIKRIGFFNEDYDPYGMNDADYAYRLNATGFLNYYLAGMKAEHIGHDVGNGTEYRKMKDEGLNIAPAKWNEWTERYEQTKDYTIFYKEWPTMDASI